MAAEPGAMALSMGVLAIPFAFAHSFGSFFLVAAIVADDVASQFSTVSHGHDDAWRPGSCVCAHWDRSPC